MARKPLSKRVRFEVFKRDQFKCQYCGGAAPDVLLTIDHVQPQSKGGANDILNLVTACSGCNSGKSAISLSDDSAVKKQRAQMKLLAEKREQLRMLVQWRDGLADLDNEQVTILTNKVNERLTAYEQHLNPSGIEMVRAWLKRFGFSAALHGIHQATASGVDALIGQMEQYAAAARKVEREPQLRDYWRIRSLLRARCFRYGPEWAPIEDMRVAFRDGVSIEAMSSASREAEDYRDFMIRIGFTFKKP